MDSLRIFWILSYSFESFRFLSDSIELFRILGSYSYFHVYFGILLDSREISIFFGLFSGCFYFSRIIFGVSRIFPGFPDLHGFLRILSGSLVFSRIFRTLLNYFKNSLIFFRILSDSLEFTLILLDFLLFSHFLSDSFVFSRIAHDSFCILLDFVGFSRIIFRVSQIHSDSFGLFRIFAHSPRIF